MNKKIVFIINLFTLLNVFTSVENPADQSDRRIPLKNDYLPPYPEGVWAHLEPLKGKEGIRALEIGPWEGRDTLDISQRLLMGPKDTLTVVDEWKSPRPEFEVQGAYHRLLFNNQTMYDARQLIIRRSHPVPFLEQQKRMKERNELRPYDFIHMRFFHNLEYGYLLSLNHAVELLAEGGIMITPYKIWDTEISQHLFQAVEAFIPQMDKRLETLEAGPYLCIKKN